MFTKLRPHLPQELSMNGAEPVVILGSLSSSRPFPLSCLCGAFETELSKHLPSFLVLCVLPTNEWKEFANSYFGMSKDGRGNVKSLNEQHEQSEHLHWWGEESQYSRQVKGSPCFITQHCSRVLLRTDISSLPTCAGKSEKRTPLLKGPSGCLPVKKTSSETLEALLWQYVLKPNPTTCLHVCASENLDAAT